MSELCLSGLLIAVAFLLAYGLVGLVPDPPRTYCSSCRERIRVVYVTPRADRLEFLCGTCASPMGGP